MSTYEFERFSRREPMFETDPEFISYRKPIDEKTEEGIRHVLTLNVSASDKERMLNFLYSQDQIQAFGSDPDRAAELQAALDSQEAESA